VGNVLIAGYLWLIALKSHGVKRSQGLCLLT
jgi:hypothetical protein